MTSISNPDVERVTAAQFQRPTGVVLKGQFTNLLRSPKGKIKGLQLRTETQTYAIKLPKYLRPMMVRELTVGTFVQVWAYPDEERWRGINILPLSDGEAIALQQAWQTQGIDLEAEPRNHPSEIQTESQPQKLCVQVCRKGKCFKQGGRQVMQSLEAAIADDPNLQHLSVEGVGCMNACKRGPNIRLPHSGKLISGVTSETVVEKVMRHA